MLLRVFSSATQATRLQQFSYYQNHHGTTPTAELLGQYRDENGQNAGVGAHNRDTAAISRKNYTHGQEAYHPPKGMRGDLLRCDGFAHDRFHSFLLMQRGFDERQRLPGGGERLFIDNQRLGHSSGAMRLL